MSRHAENRTARHTCRAVLWALVLACFSGVVASAQVTVSGPVSGSGNAKAFTVTATDTYGAASLTYVELLISPDGSGNAACLALWAQGAFYLANEANTEWIGPAGTVSNSRCTLEGAGSSSSGSGNTMTVTFNLKFKSAFVGQKSVNAVAIDTSIPADSGWQYLGSWTVVNPWTASLDPASGSGMSQVFTLTATDTAGWAALTWVQLLISAGSSACLVLRSDDNTFWLANDANNAWMGPAGTGTVSNSQCTLYGTGSSASGSGMTETINFSLSFNAGFSGLKYVQALAIDNSSGTNSGWNSMGSFDVVPLVSQTITTAPAALSVIVDGAACTSPCTRQWTQGSSHSIATTTPQSSYSFSYWTDGGALSHTISSPASPTTYTAVFATVGIPQTITTVPAGLSVTVDSLACTTPCTYQWAQGTYHTIATTTPQSSYSFSHWSDGGALSHMIVSPGTSTTYTATFPRTSNTGISPTAVEINLSAVPIDRYLALNRTDPNNPNSDKLIEGCDKSITVQSCIQRLFSPTDPTSWRSQGVTGVRFFFTMAGGHYSTPFDANGMVTAQWTNNLYLFFNDLRASGIQKVTPTPVFDPWSGPPSPNSMMQTRTVMTCTDPDGGGGSPKLLNFWPWLPYGLNPSDDYPEKDCGEFGNGGYAGAAQTPNDIFWGWNRFFSLMDTVLLQAQYTGLTVDALDYFQESNLIFTVEARMLYDNFRGVDVLQELRNRMTARGFDAGRVAPSANIPPQPIPANWDCGSYYGDSAMLLTLSELSAAIAGPYGRFGDPPYTAIAGLACFRPYEQDGMISLPVYHSQPTFLDIHSQMRYDGAPSDTATWAKNFYSDIWAFMQYRGRTGDKVVFGETNPVEKEGCTDWQAGAMLYGIPGQSNGYKNSTLFSNRASSVVMRPWHRTESGQACTPSPNTINPPFDPFNP